VANCTNTQGNSYASGNCTWYVKSRIPQLPNLWGNAAEWINSANSCSQDWGVVPDPQPGAIAVWGPGIDPPWGYGHCALVRDVRSPTDFTVDEMNYQKFNAVDTRRVTDRKNLSGFVVSRKQAQLLAATSSPSGSNTVTPGSDYQPITTALQRTGVSFVSGGQLVAGGVLVLVGVVLLVVLVSGPTVVRRIPAVRGVLRVAKGVL
jgi:surface antigen